MASTLNPATLEKLLHPIQEIRVRSLHDIESTLRRALWENVDIGVNASVLFRNLIRWFGHVPLLLELTVLEMMSLLLESQYGQEIVTFFTPTRVIKELQKIRYLTGSNAECHDLVETIIKQVECIKTGSTTSSMASSIDLDSVTNGVGNLKLDTIELTNDHGETATSGKRKGTVLPLFASRWKGDDSLYTDCWEVQDPSVARMLERFNESLLDEKNDENFQRTLNYIIPYTKNYPPEFFLQPPYIGLTLLHLIETGRVSIRKGYVMLLYIVESFRKRIRQRMLTVTYIPVQEKRARTQLSLGAFVYEMFRQCIDQMKELSCDVDELASNMMLIVLNQTTTFLMTEHFSDQQKIPAHRFGELCGSLGYLAKHYRQEFELDTNRLFTRTRYRITMQILLDFVRLWQKEPEAEYESDEAGAGGRSGTLHYKFADIKLSSSAHRTALEHSDRIWRDECLIALYDYPLKYSCPEMYEYLCTLVDRQKAPLLNLVLNMNDLLSPAVQLLRDTYINAELSDEHMLVMGSLAIKTLCLHRSMELVRILLQKIGNCSSFVTEDEPLWDIMESITVRLLANEDQDIRSEVYEICAKMMKDFVGQLDESAILTRSCLLSSTAPKLRAMGIPLTLEILTEITCFGYKDKNSKIHQSAETMLLLLCNSKAYLQEKWMDVQEVLLPIAPLLLAATVELKESKLGRVVLAMFHPDFGLPWLETLQGNLRLMFHVHGSIREEALTRVLFLLSSVERSEEFAPRIEHIGDTIPNSICMLPVPYGVGRQQIANVYDVGAVKPLLDALEQENGDPALRRSALTQLNVMADDPVLCEEIHNTSGWALVMEALCRSLQIDPQQEYPDAAIPAVGILTKLCFGIKVLRRYLGSNTTVFQLIVRALFVHHHLPVFRMECCALLYLLLFSECSTGTTPMVSLPYVCATSAFSIPFICHFHWSVSPFREVVGANGLLEGIMNNSSEDRNGAPRSDDGIAALAKVENLPHGFAVQEYVKRYIRFTFAELWYDDVDKILQLCNFKRASKASSLDDHESPLKYQGYRTALAFSADMRLSKHDIRWLKMVDFMPVFRKSLRRLGSAKAHADVHIGLATIETHLIFPLKNTVCQQDVIISTLKRYLHTPPVTVADQEMLVEVFHIIGIMLHHSFHLIRDWLYSVLATEDNFFLRLLRSDECIEPLYRKNASLLWALLQLHDAAKRYETSGSEPKQQQKDGKRELTERVSSNAVERAAVCENAWDLRVFNTALKQLDVMLKKWDVPRIVSLLQVLETMSALLDDVRRVDIAEVIPQLLHCVRAVRSTNFNGSAIVRSCLLAIAHLLERSPAEVAGFEWKSKDIVIVSTQCGNSCTLVRSFAWNILAKIARTLPGAAAIVKECAYLPGGIHACCVSTMLDRKEACLVKESAVGLLVNLLSHHTDTDGPLHSSVLPLDATAIARRAATNANSVFTNGSVDVIAELLAKQHFYEESNRSLEIYTCMEFLLDDDNKQQDPVISADLVRAFAVLYRSLIELDPFEFGLPIREKGCLQRLLKCVEQQAMLPNRAVCLMVADVCHLLLRCMDGPTRDPVCLLLAAHQNFFESIIYMLNPWLYGKLTQPVMEQTLYSIMRLLCALVVTPTGKQQIHLEFDHQDVKPIAKMIENGIVHKSKVFHMLCLKFLSLMFHTSEPIASPTGEYPSFLMQFDTMDMLAEGPDTAKSSSSLMFQDEDYSEVEDDTENTNPNRPMPTGADTEKRLKTDDTKEGTTLRSGSALIFKALLQRFKSTCNTHNLETGCFGSTNYKRTVFSTLQTMLRFSGEACRVAREHNLLAIILDWFDTIYENQIGRLSCPEFVRKHGDVKKLSIVTELKELVSLLGTWFSVPGEPLLLRMDQIDRLCQTVLQYWPWFKTHAVLHLEFLQVLAFLTESHIIVCKALAATYPGYPHSIMKLLIVTATTETAKVKGAKYDLQLLRVSLRVLKNCCCGHEGRNMIGKLNVFDNISKLHPSVTKLQKPWIEVTQMWLEFWEVYTRYADVSEVRHLTVLGALTRKSDLEIRLLAMAIVRNLTFVIGNRPTLLASLDYMFILSNALQRTSSRDELLMAAVTVWRMVANSHRGKAAIKSSPLVRLIEGQVKHYSMTPEGNDQNELWNVLMTVYRILKA
uniref:Rotatin N-terminal domain-containing protein n=1 Tax=Anopheles minimus TaxID=112268 RepID=A0A182WF54_9DIPT